jgi:hypothetical protein
MNKVQRTFIVICAVILIIIAVLENFFSNSVKSFRSCDHGCDLSFIRATYNYLELTQNSIMVVSAIFLATLGFAVAKKYSH